MMSTPNPDNPAGVPSQSPSGVDRIPSGVPTYPLHPVDPAKIGDFWPSARLLATTSGVAYLAYEDNAENPVMVIMLSQGAAEDPAARDRLAGQVERMDIDTVIARGGLDQDLGSYGSKFRSEDDDPQGVDSVPQSPWVALAFDQSTRAIDEARRVLAEIDLSNYPAQGTVSGPNYKLHWSDRFAPGSTRVWPLPWPGRRDRGGRLTILASWLLMLLIAALAVLIMILLFSQAPETPPEDPISCTIPTEATTPSDGGSGGTPTATTTEGGGGPSTPSKM
ncbi:MAG: hypothetical protein FWD55_05355 [Propionibacteriaceae bacterium]|nr:hypothetical protein [Propionibacteriaceae bacterium]